MPGQAHPALETLDARTRMVFAVTDLTGNVLGLFRMPDATVFSIDVAVAKARNVAYYADPTQLQPAVLRAIHDLFPRQLIENVATVEQIRDENVAPRSPSR